MCCISAGTICIVMVTLLRNKLLQNSEEEVVPNKDKTVTVTYLKMKYDYQKRGGKKSVKEMVKQIHFIIIQDKQLKIVYLTAIHRAFNSYGIHVSFILSEA